MHTRRNTIPFLIAMAVLPIPTMMYGEPEQFVVGYGAFLISGAIYCIRAYQIPRKSLIERSLFNCVILTFSHIAGFPFWQEYMNGPWRIILLLVPVSLILLWLSTIILTIKAVKVP